MNSAVDDNPSGAIERSADVINSDLFILLAALEVENLLSLHMRHLKKHGSRQRLPIIIQEIYNDSNSILLSEKCSSLAFHDDDSIEVNDEEPQLNSNGDYVDGGGQHNSFFSPALLQVKIHTFIC